jgi:hypothetical protein
MQVLADGSTYTYTYSPRNGDTIRAVLVHDPAGRTFQVNMEKDGSLVWEPDALDLPTHPLSKTAGSNVGFSQSPTAQ